MKTNKESRLNVDLLVCRKCGRLLPNYQFFTKNGCIWCDMEYHKRKIKNDNS